ncbi:hypothetical protein EVAR_100410_1 [Eumeta japonica]|uniref:Uncharacterized protein n=1 Tax=Eumeta variegata TaxID=151549 RepID=A0A4C1ZVQ2_EUMVA|nr:hypothetical protein EVAR_100410_1 [Eumeta japonica]
MSNEYSFAHTPNSAILFNILDPLHPTAGAGAGMSLVQIRVSPQEGNCPLGSWYGDYHLPIGPFGRRSRWGLCNHMKHYVLLGLKMLTLQFRAKDITSQCGVGKAETYIALVNGYFSPDGGNLGRESGVVLRPQHDSSE